MYVNVAVRLGGRFLSSDEFMTISRKLRNPSIRSGQALKVAATRPTFVVRAGKNRSI